MVYRNIYYEENIGKKCSKRMVSRGRKNKEFSFLYVTTVATKAGFV
jgi:hypothetical protein